MITALKITLKDGLSSSVVFVRYLLTQTELVLELRGIYSSDKSLAEVQLVDTKVDFEQLIY